MVASRLTSLARPASVQECAARLLLLVLLAALLLAVVAGRRRVVSGDGVVTLRASMPENGGWQPGYLSARVEQPLHLRLTSDDVVHSFAIGKLDLAPVDVEPGKVTELTLTFDEPGAYTFYCTRWCGPNHWRMRGTIAISGDENLPPAAAGEPPLYVQLGLDIDAPRPVSVAPLVSPSAARGAALDAAYPQELRTRETYMTQGPTQVWLALRDLPELSHLDDSALWDAVADIWRVNTTPERLALGEALYNQNCAACHGESGAGDGVFAQPGEAATGGMRGHEVEPPTDLTDPALLAASNALLQGKILRGGMGTGMPAWGSVLADEEIQALLDYLWTFQFPVQER
ncbi:MAG TPA: c-type cytochrome [Candidatus Sulfomarinibacteraceae bacterium]|nr:c-type cytochrome [Candidatus Sulfomarinibacteraceae bacterium]